MSRSGALRSPVESVTVGDFEADFIGRKIAGRYTVRAHVGGGGMADVYRAADELLGVEVAIKVLKPRMASDELRARMVQEAQAAAQVRHANLVRVFDTGKLDGTAYIVMELLDGPNLEQYVREFPDQRVPWREALALLLPALEALHAIHERGYVHRDIKPGNILVTRDPGRPPSAVVIDLGLVKPDRALRTVDSPPTTEVGRMLCTPGYTSPEQALGRPVDRRSDVYSMAITLYRVLVGRLPFHEVHGRHVAAMLARHIYHEPTRVVAAAPTADIPPGVAAVVESALRKDPARRPQTMLEFAEALRAAAAVVPGASSRRPWLLALGLTMGLGVVVALLLTGRSAAPPVSAARGQSSRLSAISDPGDPGPPVAAVIGDIPAQAVDRFTASDGPQRSLPGAATPLVDPPEHTDRSRSAPPSRAPSPRRRDLEPGWHRALALRTAEVQRCVDKTTGSVEQLAVTVNIARDGRVSTHVAGAADMPLNRCLDRALGQTLLTAPREAASFVHIFSLRTTPPSRP